MVTSILESVAAMGMAGDAGLLLLHPFTLMATAVLSAGALTATTLVRLLWGTEDTTEVILRAFSSTIYSPTRELVADSALLSFLLAVASRMRELSGDLKALIQRSEYDENLDVSVLDQGRLHAVVNDVTSFAPSQPAKPADAIKGKAEEAKEGQVDGGAEENGAQVEPLVVHRLVSKIVGDAMANAHSLDRQRGSVCELLLCTASCTVGLVSLQYDYKWDNKRSCLWRKVDLHMVRSVLWIVNGTTLQRIINALVWQLPSPPPISPVSALPAIVEAEGEREGGGQNAGGEAEGETNNDEGVVASVVETVAQHPDNVLQASIKAVTDVHLHVVLEPVPSLF